MTRILIAGGSGQLGRALIAHPWPDGVTTVAPTRRELDVADADAVKAWLRASPVSAVINAAAYTAVDRAEIEIAAAFAANALGPAALAEGARAAGAPLVHVSTDYVFAGDGSAPHEVDAAVAPLNVYGASKAAGELAVSLGQPRSAIVRASWLVDAGRSSFVAAMLRLARERPVARVVDDQHGAPTIATDLAAALATIALRMAADEAAPAGLFHFANEGDTTWHGFAAAIFAELAARGIETPRLETISSADYGAPARRPKNSRLSTARIRRDYGVIPRPWASALPGLIDGLLGDRT